MKLKYVERQVNSKTQPFLHVTLLSQCAKNPKTQDTIHDKFACCWM